MSPLADLMRAWTCSNCGRPTFEWNHDGTRGSCRICGFKIVPVRDDPPTELRECDKCGRRFLSANHFEVIQHMGHLEHVFVLNVLNGTRRPLVAAEVEESVATSVDESWPDPSSDD